LVVVGAVDFDFAAAGIVGVLVGTGYSFLLSFVNVGGAVGVFSLVFPVAVISLHYMVV
jgi:hypothetical protein